MPLKIKPPAGGIILADTDKSEGPYTVTLGPETPGAWHTVYILFSRPPVRRYHGARAVKKTYWLGWCDGEGEGERRISATRDAGRLAEVAPAIFARVINRLSGDDPVVLRKCLGIAEAALAKAEARYEAAKAERHGEAAQRRADVRREKHHRMKQRGRTARQIAGYERASMARSMTALRAKFLRGEAMTDDEKRRLANNPGEEAGGYDRTALLPYVDLFAA